MNVSGNNTGHTYLSRVYSIVCSARGAVVFLALVVATGCSKKPPEMALQRTFVGVERLSLHIEPRADSKTIAELSHNDEVLITGRGTNPQKLAGFEGPWFPAATVHGKGYVFGPLLKSKADAEVLRPGGRQLDGFANAGLRTEFERALEGGALVVEDWMGCATLQPDGKLEPQKTCLRKASCAEESARLGPSGSMHPPCRVDKNWAVGATGWKWTEGNRAITIQVRGPNLRLRVVGHEKDVDLIERLDGPVTRVSELFVVTTDQ